MYSYKRHCNSSFLFSFLSSVAVYIHSGFEFSFLSLYTEICLSLMFSFTGYITALDRRDAVSDIRFQKNVKKRKNMAKQSRIACNSLNMQCCLKKHKHFTGHHCGLSGYCLAQVWVVPTPLVLHACMQTTLNTDTIYIWGSSEA